MEVSVKIYSLVFTTVVLAVSGCTTEAPLQPQEPVGSEITATEDEDFSPDLDSYSRGVQNYLMGQLAYGNENFTDARKYLSNAQKFLGHPVPAISKRLAELELHEGDLREALQRAEEVVRNDPDDKDTLLFEASILDALGRDSQAAERYRKLIAKKEYPYEAGVYLAQISLKNGETKDAISVMQKTSADYPHEVLATLFFGRALEASGDITAAYDVMKQASEIEVNDITPQLELIRLALKKNDLALVRTHVEKILEIDPRHPYARAIAIELSQQGAPLLDTTKRLKKLTEISDDPTQVRFLIALSHFERGQSLAAERELWLILAVRPDHGPARLYLASLYATQGQTERAIAQLQKIYSADPLFVRSRFVAATLARQLGNLPKAELFAKEAIALRPEDLELQLFLGEVQRLQGEIIPALKTFQRIAESAPRNIRALYPYGATLFEAENVVPDAKMKGMAVMEEIILLEPQNAAALNFLAFGLAERAADEKNSFKATATSDGNVVRENAKTRPSAIPVHELSEGTQLDLTHAQTLIARAIEVDPANGFFLDTRGWIYFQQGKIKEAYEDVKRAFDISEGDAEIADHLADIEIVRGNKEAAVTLWKEALQKISSEPSDAESVKLTETIRAKLAQIAPQ